VSDVLTRWVGTDDVLVERHFCAGPAALLGATRARVIDEDAAHDASRDGEEMCSILPLDVVSFDQPQIRFVDEHCLLEAVTRALSRHAASRDPVQFPVDERNQSLEGTL